MASSTGYTLGPIQYEQATGKPFAMGTDGNKHYLSPRVVNPYGPAGNEGSGGLITPTSVWNDKTGKFDKQGTLEKITLAAALAPFAAAAIPAMAGGGSAAGAATGALPDTLPLSSITGAAIPGAALPAASSALPAISAGTFAGAPAGTAAGAGSAAAGAGTLPAITTATPAMSMGATVPGAGAVSGVGAVTGAVKPALNGWSDLLNMGGQMLSRGAQQSTNQDAANNTGAADWLKAMDSDYTTKLGAAVNVPAGLQKQALWSDYIQNAKTSNPDAAPTNLLTPGQQDMVASQKAVILKKLADANAMPLPTAPETPTYQQPGTGIKIASTLGTVGQVASQLPWGKIISMF